MPLPAKATLENERDAAGGEDVTKFSLIHKARRIVSVGVLGAMLGATLPMALPAIGFVALTAEGIGLAVGLTAGLLLTAKHIL
jgi:hypothetical protein